MSGVDCSSGPNGPRGFFDVRRMMARAGGWRARRDGVVRRIRCGHTRRGGRAAVGLGRGQATGCPKSDHVFEATEDAGEAGHDQGVDGRRKKGALLLRLRSTAQAGDLVAEGGGHVFHLRILTNVCPMNKEKMLRRRNFLRMRFLMERS